MHVKKGDLVVVISGKYRGKRGKVLRVLPEKGRIIVEGVNLVKRHMKPSPKNPQGGIVEKEAPIPASKVMLVDPETKDRTRVGVRVLPDGRRVRYAKKSGELIDKA
ncbi:MAG: 50S ribosomal protein L24 [Armatimonadota bacterium]|nr:50S ribosomal protein L24 [Armatimonadota bacterium]MDR7438610.1 50S ribosomal protein L24 [Armatimonadota bacterium]MDR7562669.1 50S ribosomal protein L24 [Armatimonadota bacterium]MDR7567544.1 50S ribosomal protein L24 [Armatimonadota bacterium]MDR7601768.1 50S ribosomal protein L24 [Armatimonadota bacterium]